MTIPRANPLITKSDQLRQALREGRERDALRIAKGFRMLGRHKVTIQRGWDALTNPRFAKALGRDPAQLYRDAMDALYELYPVSP